MAPKLGALTTRAQSVLSTGQCCTAAWKGRQIQLSKVDITSLASALTANVTRKAKVEQVEGPGDTDDTAEQARTAESQTAVKVLIRWKRTLDEIDRYVTSLASALTANVTQEAKRGRCMKRPENTDTAKQAHIASLETAVKAHIQRKRIRPEKALHTKHA